MAKMLTGPLVSSISGSLGPIIFAQTRFGTIVRSKPRTKIHTTPAALETKANFRRAAAIYWYMYKFYSDQFAAMCEANQLSSPGFFIGRYLRWKNGATWNPSPQWNTERIDQIVSLENRGDDHWRAHLAPSVDNTFLACWFFGGNFVNDPTDHGLAFWGGANVTTWTTRPLTTPIDAFAWGDAFENLDFSPPIDKMGAMYAYHQP